MPITLRCALLVMLFALSGEAWLLQLHAQSAPTTGQKIGGSSTNKPQGLFLDSMAQVLLGQATLPPPPCDSLEAPSLKPASQSWFKQVQAMPRDASLHAVQRENAPYRLSYRSRYEWRDEICFPDRRTHCLAVERDPSLIRYGRDLTATAENGHPGPGLQRQGRFCTSFDEGRYLICQDWDHYIGNSCWGTENTEGYERVQNGLTPLRSSQRSR